MKTKGLIKAKKKLEQFRDRFSSKQVHIMTAILEVVWIISMIFLHRNLLIEEIVTIILLGGAFIAIIMYLCIFDLDGKASKERWKQITNHVPKKFHLKTNEFVEVLLSPYDNKSQSTAMQEAVEDLRELGVRYYAKINQDNTKIVLIKKNGDGQKVGKTKIIENFVYFDANYVPKEE